MKNYNHKKSDYNMYNSVTIHPGLLRGSVTLPISKSIAHRILLGSALARDSAIENLKLNNVADDILRTLDGAKSLLKNHQEPFKIYCKDSGTTLRMILPIVCTLFSQAEIRFTESLARRPLDSLTEVLKTHGCEFKQRKNNDSSYTLYCQGQFTGGDCYLPGNISSQYISGLLYALPISDKGGSIHLTTQLASKPYVDMSLAILKDFGIKIDVMKKNGLLIYKIPGQQQFRNTHMDFSQGDWSAAAFFAVANALGSHVEMTNLTDNSLQGDRKIHYFINTINTIKNPVLNLEDYPDLFPVLAVFASYTTGSTTFTGIKRLRLKESDRIASTKAMITNLKGSFQVVNEDCVIISGTGHLQGGTVDSFHDHRIAMAAAIAATRADGPVTILNSSCCDKSYPDFFTEYAKLGGKID